MLLTFIGIAILCFLLWSANCQTDYCWNAEERWKERRGRWRAIH